MNRKPIFDAVREMLGRGFKPSEVKALDLACDLAEAAVPPEPTPAPKPAPAPAPAPAGAGAHRLGSLSEEFESGGRGPGTVSTGSNDPGGISYGVYQLSGNAGTCAAFVKTEGKPWAAQFSTHKPGSADFTAAWKAIAKADAQGFREAQHAFIERTHYLPVVEAVRKKKGLDLDKRSDAVRDVTWSCAVQHRGAATILIDAIDKADPTLHREDPKYDKRLIEAIYKRRIDYVKSVAANHKLPKGQRDQLISITQNRYPKELDKALAMLSAAKKAVVGAVETVVAAVTPSGNETIDGNAVAAANGVAVKSSAVKISKLHHKMEAAIVAAAQTAKDMGLPQRVITSGNDSKHMTGSLHFKDRALDFRGRDLKVSVGKEWAKAVSTRLGADYDVIFETFNDPNNNHLHVEYDPK